MTTSFDIAADHEVPLRDGRSLSYAEYGDPQGFPIISAHGGLACRLDVAAAAPVAEQAAVRLLSLDRPGVGLSDPQAGRTVLDWARDVEELLDLSGIGQFAAMGWSLGGQYAAAVGYALWPRVTRIAIITGALPLTEPDTFDGLPTIDRFYCRLSRRAPWVAQQCFRLVRFAAGAAPKLYGELAARNLGAADGAVLKAEGFTTFAQMCREGLRQPAGVVEEYLAMVRPWGFAPEDLLVPVDVWAGKDDRFIPPSWPPELTRRIPDATLHERAGGHFMAHLHYAEIFEALQPR
jgi:pimeloyl-ACP methyl ester carboxylesterase